MLKVQFYVIIFDKCDGTKKKKPLAAKHCVPKDGTY